MKSIYFLVAVLLLYVFVYFINPGGVTKSLEFAGTILLGLVPVFLLIYVLMVITNTFVSDKRISSALLNSRWRWILSVLGGIISTGPVYMWYPLLRELKKKGLSYGPIAAFIYSRAVKIPLIPLLIYYFGLKYTLVLTGVIVLFSFVLGMFMEVVMNEDSSSFRR